MTGNLIVQTHIRHNGGWVWWPSANYDAADWRLAKKRADTYRRGGFHSRVVADDGSLIYSTQEAS